jgi:hypothetical protein
MAMPSSSEESCRKDGVILTCYVDGKKLFRAVREPAVEARDARRPARRAAVAPRPGDASH